MKKLVIILLGIACLSGLFYIRPDLLSGLYQRTVHSIQDLERIPFIKDIQKEVNLPGPLRASLEAERAYLTKEGVISETNNRREQEGLSPLSENELLNLSAQEKLNDMFENQYFEHVSPQGVEPSEVIVSVGYDYITTGENLALGNFPDDIALVQGWMDSPGHRANILNTRYQEIGVAVGRGMYQGKETWLAVQHFGRPLSSCPSPDESLKLQIDQKTGEAEALLTDIEQRKQELENSEPSSQDEAEEHNRRVDEYNALVSRYNTFLEEIKSLAAIYNGQIETFNTCAQG